MQSRPQCPHPSIHTASLTQPKAPIWEVKCSISWLHSSPGVCVCECVRAHTHHARSETHGMHACRGKIKASTSSQGDLNIGLYETKNLQSSSAGGCLAAFVRAQQQLLGLPAKYHQPARIHAPFFSLRLTLTRLQAHLIHKTFSLMRFMPLRSTCKRSLQFFIRTWSCENSCFVEDIKMHTNTCGLLETK
jgi:hypothetical protein